MSDQAPVRVLIFDPSPVFAQGIVAVLDDALEFRIVGVVKTKSEARAAIRQRNPAIVIAAAVMVHVDVIAFVHDMLREHPEIRVVAFGDPWIDPFPIRLMCAGASGYLLKDCDAGELKTALRAVSRGKIYVSSPIASVLVDEIHRMGERSEREAPALPLELTKREAEVLEFVAVGQSNRAIALALQVSERTVENHIQRVYRKLGVHDRANAVLHALRNGYVAPLPSSNHWSNGHIRELPRELPEQRDQRAEAEARTVG